MPQTAERILDTAERLIQTHGYNGFSYQDIADAVGIRKASIHYYFPSKSDLGKAVIDRYSERHATAVAAARENASSHWEALEAYLAPFRAFASDQVVCLCGAFAAEFASLSEPVQERAGQFFRDHERWMAKLLEAGRAAGEFQFSGPAERLGRHTFCALQGALLVQRATGESVEVEDTIASLKAMLRGEG